MNFEYLGINRGKFGIYAFRNVYGADSLTKAIWYYMEHGYEKIRAKPGEVVFEKDDKTVVIWAYDYN